ncbi:MAG: response regulator [Verrucomicrobiota bacterium]
MARHTNLRWRLGGILFLALAPAGTAFYFTRNSWAALAAGLLTLAAIGFGGWTWAIRNLNRLHSAMQRFGSGDLSARSGLDGAGGEVGLLARTFDLTAAGLQRRLTELESAEHRHLNRSLQQAAVAALGQFALVTTDFSALMNQAVLLVSQTLELEHCRILELLPARDSMVMRAGAGWKKGAVGLATVGADRSSQAGYTLASGEPVLVGDLRNDTRFQAEPLLVEHGLVSGVCVAIGSREKTYGVLSVYSARQRDFTSDEVQFLLSVANALAVAVQRLRSEAEILKLAEFGQLNPNPAIELTADGAVTCFNKAALRLAEAVGRKHPSDILPPDIRKLVQAALATGQSKLHVESRMEGRVLSWSMHPVIAGQVVHCYVSDITDRLSLEAVVAHDLNNMLTVIQGHAGMLMSRDQMASPLRDSAQAVYSAAERAAGLTRQLLMFNRKTVMQPRPLDMRELVGNMSKMLKRLIGEKVTLDLNLDPAYQLPMISGDAGMLEQVISNLAVNARDAMPQGGTLTIGVQAVAIDKAYVQMRPEARAGMFVSLRVSDTGCGMDTATLGRLFEPFFTTKELGKAAGLGLATVYGIVKQHEGWVEVASKVGEGSTFSVFLPASGETPKSVKTNDALLAPVRGGSETVLVVEDEPSVRLLGSAILQDCGYKVIEASSGVEALQLWDKQEGPVDLLLTDMIMPQGVSGVELAQKLQGEQPGLKVVFISGYNVDDVDADYIRKGKCTYLQKPFTRSTLARVVRDSLDGKAGG